MKNKCCHILIKFSFPLDYDYQLLNSLKAWHICYYSKMTFLFDSFPWYWITDLIMWMEKYCTCLCLFVCFSLFIFCAFLCLSVSLELSSRNYWKKITKWFSLFEHYTFWFVFFHFFRIKACWVWNWCNFLCRWTLCCSFLWQNTILKCVWSKIVEIFFCFLALTSFPASPSGQMSVPLGSSCGSRWVGESWRRKWGLGGGGGPQEAWHHR